MEKISQQLLQKSEGIRNKEALERSPSTPGPWARAVTLSVALGPLRGARKSHQHRQERCGSKKPSGVLQREPKLIFNPNATS